MKSIAEALSAIVPCFAPLGAVRLPLLSALGAVLSEDVIAGGDLPPFDNSAMDGYAARFAELQAGAALPVQAESRAGGHLPPPLATGAVQRIFTGAPLPEGADTVVIQENTTQNDAAVRIDVAPTAAFANVRKRGEELARGSLALAAGTPLFAAEIGLLAALGLPSVSVHRRPRVAIVTSGDELREIGAAHEPGTIVGSNAYALAAHVLELGAEPWILPIVKDDATALAATLGEALRADAVLSVGGASVGDYDCMRAACALAGIELAFWKVAIKPGKPLLFGSAGRTPVLGLPGNPVSALITFELFARPSLLRMAGHRELYPTLFTIELAHAHRHSTGRTELARALLEPQPNGRVLARLHPQQGSGSLSSMCAADALVVLPADTEDFACGASLSALRLRAARRQREIPFE